MRIEKWLKILGTSLLLAGCGDNSSSTTSITNETQNEAIPSTTSLTIQEELTLPSSYTYPAINNKGLAVTGQMDNYNIKIYSSNQEVANAQSIHKGVVVKLNDQTSEVMPIQISYLNKKIVVIIENEKGEKVAISKEIEVSDVPVVIIELTI